MSRPAPPCRQCQKGAALIIAMVLLAIILVIGIGAYVSASSQLRLAGNIQFQSMAMDRAELSLVQARKWLTEEPRRRLDSRFTTRSPDNGLYPIGSLANTDLRTMAWTDENSKSINSADEQRYVIELLARGKRPVGYGMSVGGRESATCDQVDVFRLTTRGLGPSRATRFVQEVYSVPGC